MGADIHIFIEWRNKGCPWQADEGHTVEVEDSCGSCPACEIDKPEQCPEAYIQVKQCRGGNRNYDLFGKLAGVRRDGPRPKGIPSDASATILQAVKLYGSDGHSHSYESFDNFKKILKKLKYDLKGHDKDRTFDPYDFTSKNPEWPDYIDIINHCEKLIKEKSLSEILLNDSESDVEVRLVFYFDN